MTQRPLDLIRAAQENQVVKIEFGIPVNDGELPAVLTAPDIYAIMEVQEEGYQVKYAEYKRKGYDQESVNEELWTKELEGLSTKVRKRMEEDKPVNLADQLAKRISRFRTVQELIPRYLKDPEGNLLFPTSKEQGEFREILCSNMNLMNLLAEKYAELFTKLQAVGEKVKN